MRGTMKRNPEQDPEQEGWKEGIAYVIITVGMMIILFTVLLESNPWIQSLQ